MFDEQAASSGAAPRPPVERRSPAAERFSAAHRLLAGLKSCATLVMLLLGVSSVAAAQAPPPISGVTGTMALEGTVKKVYAAANTIVVGTIDGVEHVFHYTKNVLVHGSGANSGPLEGLKEGSPVVVHYATDGTTASALEVDSIGDDGLKTTEGVVTGVDRRRKQITIKYADGKIETLRLTDRAAADVGKDIGQTANDSTRVIVYYSGDAAHKVAHYFKTVAR